MVNGDLVKRLPADSPVSYDGTYRTRAETCIATIDAGYGDGYSRRIGNRGFVLVGGRRCPVVGWVTMNFAMIDTGPDGGVCPGDEVVLLGEQGDGAIWADEIADWCGTISYEILTGIKTEDRRLVYSKERRR